MSNNYIDEDIVICFQVANGKAKATLKKEHILETYANVEMLVKSTIYVAVSVLTETGEWIMCASKCKSKYRVNICS